jgi:hypothetical protein
MSRAYMEIQVHVISWTYHAGQGNTHRHPCPCFHRCRGLSVDIQEDRQVVTGLYLDWLGHVEWWPVQVAWTRVARPQELDRLGVLDLTTLGYALQMRWSWLARTDPGLC